MNPLDEIARAPWTWDFHAAGRAIEEAHPERPRLGTARRPVDDPVRFGQEASLAFAPSSIAGVEPGGAGPERMVVRFFGLLGPNGPLPHHITEYILQQRNAGSRAIGRFLDLFHHRLLTLFYRAWADAQPAVEHDRPEHDRFARYVGSMAGYGLPSLEGRDRFPDGAKRVMGARLGCLSRSPEGLRALLESFFELPFAVEPFRGHWIEIVEPERLRLGESVATGSLGRNASLGERLWDCQEKFRIVAGPLRFAEFERFLPGGRPLDILTDAVRNFIGDELAWDLQLVLRADEVPPTRLGGTERLGLTTWLVSHAPTWDPGDVIVDPARTT